MAKGGYVYFMANKTRSVLYVGVTSNLELRVHQHKMGEGSSFTKKYNCFDLVYHEFHEYIMAAIEREKQIKRWKREWKDNLVKSKNPGFNDLSDEIVGFN